MLKNIRISRQTRSAFVTSWLIISAVLLLVPVTPMLMDRPQVYRISRALQTPHTGNHKCPLCGMTTSFICIANGEWSKAHAANRYAIGLWLAIVGNELLAACCLFRIAAQGRRAAIRPANSQTAYNCNITANRGEGR